MWNGSLWKEAASSLKLAALRTLLLAQLALFAGALGAQDALGAQESSPDTARGDSQGEELRAEESGEEEIDQVGVEELVVIGSRHTPRSTSDTPVPVDLIEADTIAAAASGDIQSILASAAPSYNVGDQPNNGAASLVRPPYLRGLPGDSTLALINGKRLHRSSIINVFAAGITDGSHGADLASIPAIALERIEVLRDGASAQYGSDAVAGALNLVLKEDSHGAVADLRWKQHFEGDGKSLLFAGNVGLPLLDIGFANLSLEYSQTDPTSRSRQRDNAQAFIDEAEQLETRGGPYTSEEQQAIDRGTNVDVPAQIWGNNKVDYDIKALANFGLLLSERVTLYSFVSFAERKVAMGFWYRAPNASGTARVFPEDENGNPILPELSDGSVFDPRTDLYPGGFTPQFGALGTDWNLALGVRGELGNQWSYDLSAIFGQHESEFSIWDTINPQLLHLKEEIPHTYRPGGYRERDYTISFNMLRALDIAVLPSPLFIALGLERRSEKFKIIPGGENSYFRHPTGSAGPFLNSGSFGVGSDGFPGFNPDFAGSASSVNNAAYVDVETNLTADVLVNAALRFEDYDAYDGVLNGKLAGRWQAHPMVALRGSLGTGFRAPTAGQVSLVEVTSAFDENGVLVNNVTLPPEHPASIALGAKALEPESSRSLSLGALFAPPGNLSVTMDYYRVWLSDRIALTGRETLNQEQIDSLVAQNVPGSSSIRSVRFFANNFDTRTQGLDLVATLEGEWLGSDAATLTLAANWNDTKVERFSPKGLSQARIEKRVKQIEDALPKSRATLTFDSLWGGIRVLGRLRYYGGFHEYHADFEGWEINVGSEVLLDLELTYEFSNGLSLTLAADNLFNTHPDDNPWVGQTGSLYPVASPFGFNGGLWLLKLAWQAY